jgi:LysR family transcriptional activator of nhaA
MNASFNYKHLYYDWEVVKEGGISRGTEKLGMAVPAVSAKVRELERTLGYALLKPAGRGLVLTEAGLDAMQQADLIFQLGEMLPCLVRDAFSTQAVRLAAISLACVSRVCFAMVPVIQMSHSMKSGT